MVFKQHLHDIGKKQSKTMIGQKKSHMLFL